jgi:hypothetical protein
MSSKAAKRKREASPPPPRSPTPLERRDAEAAGERSWARPAPVEIRVDHDADGKPQISAPHDDLDLWRVKLLDSLGTRSTDFAARTLAEVTELTSGGRVSQLATNAALALVSNMRPQNEAEALLLAQMAGAHAGAVQAMKSMHRAEWFNQTEGWGRLANAFMRTYALQLQTLDKIRRRGAQTVRVEHVHVHEGGRAIVGHVETGGGGEREFDDQPHASGKRLEGGAAVPFAPMWREDTQGGRVRGAGGQGTEAVPDARRDQPRRAAR